MVSVTGKATVGTQVINVSASVTLPAVVPTPTTGFPTATSTGYTGTLTTGPTTISSPGVYQNLNISGGLVINGTGVTVRNCRITGGGYAVVNTRNATGAVIENCTIDGLGTGEGSHGVLGKGFSLVKGCKIVGIENGVTFEGSNQTVRGNYIADLKAPGSPHYDGLQIDGGQSNLLIEDNTIINQYGQTAAIMIDNYFGPINGIIVNHNRLIGGGYTIYSSAQFTGGTVKGVQFTNNRFGKGYWGYSSIVGNTPVWTGNVDDVTGKPI